MFTINIGRKSGLLFESIAAVLATVAIAGPAWAGMVRLP